MDYELLGKKVKASAPGGVAKDGRKYTDIPDSELGQKFLQSQGATKTATFLQDIGKVENNLNGTSEGVPTAAEKTKSDSFKTSLDLLNQSKLSDQFSKVKTGPLTSIRNYLFQNVSPALADKDAMKLESNVAPIRDTIIQAISGAQVPAAEAARLEAWLPSVSKSPEKNKLDLNSLTTWLSANYKNNAKKDYSYKAPPEAAGSPQASAQPSRKEVAPWLNTVAQMGGGLAGGIAGGAAGGLAGIETGPGALATGYLGAVGGAGVGSGAGNALADYLRKGLGDQTVDTSKTGANSVDAGMFGAGAEALGIPLAKGLGFLAHPIKPFVKQVDNILAKSTKNINIGDVGGLLEQFQKEELPKFREKGLGKEAQEAYNSLSGRVVDIVSSLKKHVPGDAGVTEDINKLELSAENTNKLKRAIYQLNKDMYGEIGKPEVEVNKAFGRVVKNALEKAEPGIATPNKIASAMYKVPDTVTDLTGLLALGNPGAARGLRAVTGLPGKAVQKAVPANGGYLKKTLPRLFQLLYPGSQDE